MRASLAVFGPVLRNHELRPAAAAFAGFQAAEYAVWVAMLGMLPPGLKREPWCSSGWNEPA